MANARRMALGRRRQIFHAVVDHLNRMAALHGQQGRVAGKYRWIVLFAAERAARLSLDDAHLILGKIEYTAQRFEYVVGALQRSPYGDATFGIVLRDHAVVFNVKVFLRAGTVLSLDNVGRSRPNGIDVAFFQKKSFDQVIGAPDDHLLPLALFDGEDRRQGIVFDLHRTHRLAHSVTVGVGQQHNWLFAVVHPAVGHAGLIGNDQVDVIFARHIRCSNDRELAPVNVAVECNGTNDSPRNRAANGSSAYHIPSRSISST